MNGRVSKMESSYLWDCATALWQCCPKHCHPSPAGYAQTAYWSYSLAATLF